MRSKRGLQAGFSSVQIRARIYEASLGFGVFVKPPALSLKGGWKQFGFWWRGVGLAREGTRCTTCRGRASRFEVRRRKHRKGRQTGTALPCNSDETLIHPPGISCLWAAIISFLWCLYEAGVSLMPEAKYSPTNISLLDLVCECVCVCEREREKQRWYQFSLNQWWFIGVFTPSLHSFYNEVYQEIILRCIWIGDRWKHQFC